MSWTAVQEQMKARNSFASSALGGLGVLVGMVLLRRPVPRWIAVSTIVDGGVLAVTGKGLITRAWHLVTSRTSNPSGETPALEGD